MSLEEFLDWFFDLDVLILLLQCSIIYSMKNYFLWGILFVIVFSNHVFGKIYMVDPIKSSVEFNIVQFRFGEVRGSLGAYSIVFDVNDELTQLLRVEAKVDVNSIETDSKTRDRHLKSDEFFDMMQYPDMTFLSMEVQSISDQILTGNMSIKGVVLPMELPYTLEKIVEDGKTFVHVQSEFKVNRKQFGLTGYPFMIDDEAMVKLNLYFRGVKDVIKK